MGGKWVHRLSNVDPETREADCANCGRVPLKNTGHGWRCRLAVREERRRRSSRSVLSHSGASYVQRDALGEQQGWLCGICGADVKEDPVLDHCHDTGTVRGILCRRCNTGMGMLQDDPELLKNAIEYLTQYE
jgi:hypothetical protein